MDAGEYEAEPFYAAGGDICTVLGAAGIATIKGVIAAAKKHGGECQVDMINVNDKAAFAKECVAAGAQIIGVHTGLDAQAAGHTPFADLADIAAAVGDSAKISVAGGVKANTAAQVVEAGANIVVAGAAIYGAADPAAAAAEITGIVHAGNASAGGMKWLPWAIIAGAVLLGLYLLNGGTAQEAPADAATMEQAVEATAEATGDVVESTGEAMEEASDVVGDAIEAAAE